MTVEKAVELTRAIERLVMTSHILENNPQFGPDRFAWGLQLRVAAHQLIDKKPMQNWAWIKSLLVKPAAFG